MEPETDQTSASMNLTNGSTAEVESDEPFVLSDPVSAHLMSEMKPYLYVQVKDDGTGFNQLTNALVERYKVALAGLEEATAAIIEHCRKTNQTVPFDFLYMGARTTPKLPAKTRKGRKLPPWLLDANEVFPASVPPIEPGSSYHECPECKQQVQHDTSNVACPHCWPVDDGVEVRAEENNDDPAVKPGTIFAA